MSEPTSAGPTLAWLLLGLFATMSGGVIVLAGLGIVPIPEGSAKAPLWVVGLAGSVFLFLGLFSLFLAMLGRRDPQRAERIVRGQELSLAGWLVALYVVAVFCAVSAWSAWGPGPRSFSGSAGAGGIGVRGSFGESVGRTVFAVSAVFTGLTGLWMLIWGIRRLRRR